MKKKIKKKSEAQVDPELRGLEISVNAFGEVVSNVAIDRLNDFLDRKVVDRKLEEKKLNEQGKTVGSKKRKRDGRKN